MPCLRLRETFFFASGVRITGSLLSGLGEALVSMVLHESFNRLLDRLFSDVSNPVFSSGSLEV